jgi:hypothetical protein
MRSPLTSSLAQEPLRLPVRQASCPSEHFLSPQILAYKPERTQAPLPVRGLGHPGPFTKGASP